MTVVGSRGGEVAVRKGEFWTISVGPCLGGCSASAVAGRAKNRRTRRPLEMQATRRPDAEAVVGVRSFGTTDGGSCCVLELTVS